MFARTVETYEFKLQAIKYSRDHGVSATLKKFYGEIEGTTRETKGKSLHEWSKRRVKIEAWWAKGTQAIMREIREVGVATTLPSEAEQEIVRWITSLRDDDVPVSALMLQIHALEVARQLGISKAYFTASWSWSTGFLKIHAHSFRCKTCQGQISPTETAAVVQELKTEIRGIMEAHGLDRFYNADQTAVFFEYLPKKTLHKSGERTAWVRCSGREKDRLSAMLLADSTGEKYAPFLILKAKLSSMPETEIANRTQRHGFGIRIWREIHALQAKHDVAVRQCARVVEREPVCCVSGVSLWGTPRDADKEAAPMGRFCGTLDR